MTHPFYLTLGLLIFIRKGRKSKDESKQNKEQNVHTGAESPKIAQGAKYCSSL